VGVKRSPSKKERGGVVLDLEAQSKVKTKGGGWKRLTHLFNHNDLPVKRGKKKKRGGAWRAKKKGRSNERNGVRNFVFAEERLRREKKVTKFNLPTSTQSHKHMEMKKKVQVDESRKDWIRFNWGEMNSRARNRVGKKLLRKTRKVTKDAKHSALWIKIQGRIATKKRRSGGGEKIIEGGRNSVQSRIGEVDHLFKGVCLRAGLWETAGEKSHSKNQNAHHNWAA